MSDRPLRLLLVVTALLALTTPTAFADAIHWTNPAGGNWSEPANWSPATVPAETDTAVVDLAGSYTVTLDVDLVLAGLRLNGAPSGIQTLAATGLTLTFEGPATIGEQGVAAWSGCTINGAGEISNLGLITLASSSVEQGLANGGTIVISANSGLIGALTTTTNSVIRVEGGSSGNATLTVVNGFTNNGAIVLTTTDPSRTSTFKVTVGTLRNAVGGSISALPGAGGTIARNLTVALDNQGVLTLGHPLMLNKTSASHVNSGTMDLVGGDLTILLNGTSSSFATSGAIQVPAGRRLTLQSSGSVRPFDYNGGTMGGDGAITLTNALLHLNVPAGTAMTRLGGTASTISGSALLTIQAGTTLALAGSTLDAPSLVEPSATLDLDACSVTRDLTNAGTFVARGTTQLNGMFSTASGSMLRVEGGSAAAATLTMASGFTNSGTIELTSTSVSNSATLEVSSGTLVNAVGAQINALPGAGGIKRRDLTTAIDNRGTITVSQRMNLGRPSAVHFNTGALDLSGGDLTVLLSGASTSFTTSGPISLPSGRTLALQGSVSGGAGQNFYYAGGLVAAAGTVSLSNATFNLSVDWTSTARLTASNSLIAGPGAFTFQPGVAPSLVSTTITAPVAIVSGATLEVAGTSLTLGSLTTVPGATVRVKGTAGGNAQLAVTSGFTNRGTIEITNDFYTATATLMLSEPDTLVNEAGASINILLGAGGEIAHSLAAAVDNRGTINVGHVALFGHGYWYGHLMNTGSINLTTGDLTLSGFTTSGAINVPAGRTLTLAGGRWGSNYNGGTMGGAGTVSVAGTLYLNAGLGTSMAHLTASSSTIAGPGTLTVQSGTTAYLSNTRLSAPTVVESGGTLDWAGYGYLTDALTAGPGSVMRVRGVWPHGGGTLFVPNNFINHGTIELTSSDARYSARLQMSGAGTLINAWGASIASLQGQGVNQVNYLTTAVDNRGTITVAYPLTLDKLNVVHHNLGTITVQSGKLLTVGGTSFSNDSSGVLEGSGTIGISTGTSFAQNGRVRPGSSCGRLTINGPYLTLGRSVLDVEIGGGTAGSGYDQLCVRDAAVLTGTLNISVVNGYEPPSGSRYVIADFGSCSGSFGVVNGLVYGEGRVWSVAYSDTDVALVTEHTVDVPPPPAEAPVLRTGFALAPSPNPARGNVAMTVEVAREQRVDLNVYDVTGRRVASLHTGTLAAGRYPFTWTGGRSVAPGLYLIRLSAEDLQQTVRIVRIE